MIEKSEEKPFNSALNPTSSENWETYWQLYETAGYVNYTPELLDTLKTYVELSGAKVLEIGSGTGGNASELARLGAKVTTLDFAPTALSRTLVTAKDAGVHLLAVQADARTLPFADGAMISSIIKVSWSISQTQRTSCVRSTVSSRVAATF